MIEKKAIGDASAFGIVYKLTISLDQPVIVVKEIAKARISDGEFENELSALKELAHTNIVNYLDCPQNYTPDPEKFSIFMEFCTNGSLRTVINESTIVYSISTIFQWSKEILSALAYLERKGRVHCDLKLENVLVTDVFVTKLCDFGISEKLTNFGEIARGTEPYVAPEVYSNQSIEKTEICKRDIYAAGLILWQLLTRKPIDSNFSSLEIYNFTPVTVTEGLHRIIIRCLKTVAERPKPTWALRWLKDEKEELEDTWMLHKYEKLPIRNGEQKVLLRPVGFDGTLDWIGIDSNSTEPQDLVKTSKPTTTTINETKNSNFSVPDITDPMTGVFKNTDNLGFARAAEIDLQSQRQIDQENETKNSSFVPNDVEFQPTKSTGKMFANDNTNYGPQNNYLLENFGEKNDVELQKLSANEAGNKDLNNTDATTSKSNSDFVVHGVEIPVPDSMNKMIIRKTKKPLQKMPIVLHPIENSTNFDTFLMNEYLQWKIPFISRSSPTKPEEIFGENCQDQSEYLNVNHLRRKCVKQFRLNFLQMTAEEKLVFEREDLENFKKKSSFLTPLEFIEFPFEMESGESQLEKTRTCFYRLLNFDAILQSLVYMQAFHALIEFDRNSLNDWDLMRLLCLTSRNVKELEKIFQKPLSFEVSFLEESKDEWCSNPLTLNEKISWFKSDLSRFLSEEARSDISCDTRVLIYIQSLWRALEQKKTILQRYLSLKNKKLDRGLQHFREVLHKHPYQIYEVWFRTQLKLTTDGPSVFLFVSEMFPGFQEAFVRIPINGGFPSQIEGNRESLRTSAFPVDEERQAVNFHTYYQKAFYLINRCRFLSHTPEILMLIIKLLKNSKKMDPNFVFACLKVNDPCYGDGIYFEPLNSGFVLLDRKFELKRIMKDCQLINDISVIGFIVVKWGDLRGILEEMLPSLRGFHRGLAEFEILGSSLIHTEYSLQHEEKMTSVVEKFWADHKVVPFDATFHFSSKTLAEIKEENFLRNAFIGSHFRLVRSHIQ